MLTIREFVSTVRHNLQSLTLDNYISGEYIYNVGLAFSKLITKRESDSRKLFKSTSLFKTISCVEMEEISIAQCTNVSIPKCKKVMRSKKPLPETQLSSFGSLLFVNNILRDKNYIEINPISYKSVTNQQYRAKNTGYFWIENNYLVIPDSEVEVVTVTGLFTDVMALTDDTTDSCGKILDKPFPVLEYLLSSVIDYTIQKVSVLKQISIDESSNLDTKS